MLGMAGRCPKQIERTLGYARNTDRGASEPGGFVKHSVEAFSRMGGRRSSR